MMVAGISVILCYRIHPEYQVIVGIALQLENMMVAFMKPHRVVSAGGHKKRGDCFCGDGIGCRKGPHIRYGGIPRSV